MFDIGREGQSDHEEIISRVAKPMGRLLQAASGDCDSGTCKVENAFLGILDFLHQNVKFQI